MTISPQKVAAGRKLPLDKVREAARGRVWSGADAKAQGLVDGLGGFWTAAGDGGRPGQGSRGRHGVPGLSPAAPAFWRGWARLSGGLDASLGLLGRIESLLNLPALQAVLGEVSSLPRAVRAARCSSGRHICRGRDRRITGSCKETACSGKSLNYNFRCAGARSWLGGTITAIMVRCGFGAFREPSRACWRLRHSRAIRQRAGQPFDD